MNQSPIITVIGSINMDMVTLADQTPIRGETLMGKSFQTFPGGKGANQAVAAARLGGNVQFIGRVGDDPFGKQLLDGLEQERISISGVEPVTDESTGVATIILSNGDNRIIVVPGANNHVTPEYLEKFKHKILASSIIVLQFEIPLETVRFCLKLCEQHNIPVILNPAPARKLDLDEWEKATYITPNETEAEELFSHYQKQLQSKLIITLGENGVKFTNNGVASHISAHKVKPIDSTGAGDTFNGALAVALAEDIDLQHAINFANAAAALSVQRYGAQGGMPTKVELEAYLNENNESVK